MKSRSIAGCGISTAASSRSCQCGEHSWLLVELGPVIGDPLTIAAGIMRERFIVFLLLVAVAKIGRYVVLAAVTAQYLG